MKRILIATTAFLFFGNSLFAQKGNETANRPAPQNYGWQDNNRNHDNGNYYGNQGHNDGNRNSHRWNKNPRYQNRRHAGYVRNHPAYYNILAARIPLRESRTVEAQLHRIEEMEARFAHNGRLEMRERALLDRELIRLDAHVARYNQRGYVWR